jgi:pimeloyl-ACP methyl ester carboxylesterase
MWEMSMYNPQLRHWLARIAGPTLVVWGESDGVVTPDYGRAYASLIPDARCETIAAAGHHPAIEPPEELAALFGSFSG